MAALEVRLQALDGTWETVGVDRYPGVVAEGFTAAANEWGHDTCSFVLRRPTDVQHPDLSSFTPAEVWRGGSLIFEGRVKETPTTEGPEGQIAVTGVGWQAHTDDDQYERTFVQSDMTVWQDVRSKLTADLTKFRTNGQVEVNAGAIVLSFPPGTSWAPASDAVGVVLDLGADPGRWCKRICALAETSIGNADLLVYVRAHDSEGDAHPAGATAETIINGLATNSILGYSTTASSGTWLTSTATKPHRYWTIFLYPGGAIGAPAAGQDYAIRIKQALLFRDAAYESGNASVLKASDVVRDAVDTACPLLSTDRSLIQATSFNLPEFALDGPHTARDVITAANAVHRWRTRIRRGKVPEFAPQPNAPLFKVGSWPGSRFQDASAGSGEEIYNRVLVTGTGPDGVALTVERKSGDWRYDPAVQAQNPSAAVDASGWSGGGPDTPVRDTGVFNSAPASFKMTATVNYAVGPGIQGALANPSALIPGRTYRVDVAMRASAVGVARALPVLVFIDRNVVTLNSLPAVSGDLTALGTSFTTISSRFTCPPNTYQTGLDIYIELSSGASIYWDDIALYINDATLIDRRGFTRTKELQIGSALTPALANQLGDVFLQTHARTPLKGSIDISPGGLRSVATDEDVHPSELLNNTTELIRLAHLIDPDTGAVGRDGIIASASYSEETETANVQLDNDRRSFDQLLQRMQVVTGSVRT
jgi:hypothetical protein